MLKYEILNIYLGSKNPRFPLQSVWLSRTWHWSWNQEVCRWLQCEVRHVFKDRRQWRRCSSSLEVFEETTGWLYGRVCKIVSILKLPNDVPYLWHFFYSVLYISFIKWNFTKFIVDKNGIPVARHATTTDPIVIRFKNQNVFPNAYIYLF